MATCPVLLVCGFLGSGKTTLLRGLLERNEGYRIAVVRNEFSDVVMDFEVPLLVTDDDDVCGRIIELPNTCVCCSAKSGFVAAINGLVSRYSDLDMILCELSGLTDPLALCDEFIATFDPVTDKAQLAGVVTIIDITRYKLSLPGMLDQEVPHSHADAYGTFSELFVRFLVAADVALCNKIDKKPMPDVKEVLGSLHSRIRCVSPDATIVDTCQAQLSVHDLIKLTKVDRYFDKADLTELSEWCDVVEDGVECLYQHAAAAPGSSVHESVHDVVPIVISVERGDALHVDSFEVLESRLCNWVWTAKPALYRAKGLIYCAGQWGELQICGESVSLLPVAPAAAARMAATATRCLFIGKNLSKTDILAVMNGSGQRLVS